MGRGFFIAACAALCGCVSEPLARVELPDGHWREVVGTASDDLWTWGEVEDDPGALRIHHWNGEIWDRVRTPDALAYATGVSAVATKAGELWLASTAGDVPVVLTLDDAGGIVDHTAELEAESTLHPTLALTATGEFVAVHFVPREDEPIDAHLFVSEGAALRPLAPPPLRLRVEAVLGIDDIWGSVFDANGEGGALVHFDGTTWADTGEVAGRVCVAGRNDQWTVFGEDLADRAGGGLNLGYYDGAWRHERVMPGEDDQSVGAYGPTESRLVGVVALGGPRFELYTAQFSGQAGGGAGESVLLASRWSDGAMLPARLVATLAACDRSEGCLPPLRVARLGERSVLVELRNPDLPEIAGVFVGPIGE